MDAGIEGGVVGWREREGQWIEGHGRKVGEREGKGR